MKSKLLTLLLCSGSVEAALEMSPTSVQHVTLSKTGLTRISIENEGIKDMFAYPGSVSNSVTLHQSGHLFVAPAGLNEPIFLTIISSSGETQDLKLSFAQKAPRPVILKVKKEKRVSQQQVERWLSVALLRETPRGFRRESPKHDKRVSAQATAHEVDRFSNGVYDISVCEVRSKKSIPITLSPEIFLDQEEGGRLSSTQVMPQGATTLVIIKKREGK